MKGDVVVLGGRIRVLGVSWEFGVDRVGGSRARAFRIGRDGGIIYYHLAAQPGGMVVRAEVFLSPHRAQLRETTGTVPRGLLGGLYEDIVKAREGVLVA